MHLHGWTLPLVPPLILLVILLILYGMSTDHVKSNNPAFPDAAQPDISIANERPFPQWVEGAFRMDFTQTGPAIGRAQDQLPIETYGTVFLDERNHRSASLATIGKPDTRYDRHEIMLNNTLYSVDLATGDCLALKYRQSGLNYNKWLRSLSKTKSTGISDQWIVRSDMDAYQRCSIWEKSLPSHSTRYFDTTTAHRQQCHKTKFPRRSTFDFTKSGLRRTKFHHPMRLVTQIQSNHQKAGPDIVIWDFSCTMHGVGFGSDWIFRVPEVCMHGKSVEVDDTDFNLADAGTVGILQLWMRLMQNH